MINIKKRNRGCIWSADFLDTCIMLKLYLSDLARVMSKQSMRQETAEKLRSKQDSDIKNFVDFAVQDSVQKSLGFYLEQLKKKSKK